MSVLDALVASAPRPVTAEPPPLLELHGLRKEFTVGGGLLARLTGRAPRLVAVADVDLVLRRGAVLGLVGESGSGKSTLAQVAVRLEPATAGRIVFDEADVTQATGAVLRRFRRRVQIVFQDTNSSLNPRKTVGRVLAEPLALRGIARRERAAEAARLLRAVGLVPDMLGHYPHQLSGGQRQRVGIARALAMAPELLVADEPVSSLDVSLQAQIVLLLMELRRELGLTMLFISHDLALVGQLSTELAVMFRGRIVERGTPREVLRAPAHPYTRALIAAIPAGLAGRGRAVAAVAPAPDPPPGFAGCSYAFRCDVALPQCRDSAPPTAALSATHGATCHRLP